MADCDDNNDDDDDNNKSSQLWKSKEKERLFYATNHVNFWKIKPVKAIKNSILALMENTNPEIGDDLNKTNATVSICTEEISKNAGNAFSFAL